MYPGGLGSLFGGFARSFANGANSMSILALLPVVFWIMVLFAPFFFLWNPLWVGFFMIPYALAENIPLIMAQRYNRYRLRRVLSEDGTPEVRAING